MIQIKKVISKRRWDCFLLTGSLIFYLPTTKSGHLKINTTQSTKYLIKNINLDINMDIVSKSMSMNKP